jgi:hypothetical protein
LEFTQIEELKLALQDQVHRIMKLLMPTHMLNGESIISKRTLAMPLRYLLFDVDEYKDHSAAFLQYAKMRDALNATGRPIFFSLCGWEEWYAPMGYSLGNSWRIGI